MAPTSPLFLMWIKKNRCLFRMKDPQLIIVSSPSNYKLRYKNDETEIRTQQYIQGKLEPHIHNLIRSIKVKGVQYILISTLDMLTMAKFVII